MPRYAAKRRMTAMRIVRPPVAVNAVPAAFGDARLPARFWARVLQHTDTGCWLWQRSLRNGYGRVRVWVADDSQRVPVHRLTYETFVGAIPEGLQIDHLRKVCHCCNPAHLEAVTSRVNTLRGATLSAANASKTHCCRGHEFTEANTYLNPKGKRVCLACRAARARKSREAPGVASATPGTV